MQLKSLIFLLPIPLLFSFLVFLLFSNSRPSHDSKTPFTPAELALFNGKTKNSLYISIVGSIFDVTEGRRHYEEGQAYHGFVGRDNSRAFATGEFGVKEVKGLDDLNNGQIGEIHRWLLFFKEKYPEVGFLIGTYYNEKGEQTENLIEFYRKKNLQDEFEQKQQDFNNQYPRCNSKWEIDKGGEVWCEDRNKVPRKHYPITGGTNYNCVCVLPQEAEEKKEIFLKYDACANESNSCKF